MYAVPELNELIAQNAPVVDEDTYTVSDDVGQHTVSDDMVTATL